MILSQMEPSLQGQRPIQETPAGGRGGGGRGEASSSNSVAGAGEPLTTTTSSTQPLPHAPRSRWGGRPPRPSPTTK